MGPKLQQAFFLLRLKYLPGFFSIIRKLGYAVQGMKVGRGTSLPVLHTTWPHQVIIGADCQLEANIIFKYDGIWSKGPSIRIGDNVFIGSGCEFNINTGITIGRDANIASGCKFIDHDHGSVLGIRIGAQPSVRAPIEIAQDVWLGVNVVVLKGVTIGAGAIVAAGAVVNKSIPENQIWGGIPAKFIKTRT
jgi:acetyltransferase-like isoleucine patch superfamily enzyme